MFTHVSLPEPKYNWIRSTNSEGKRVYIAEGTEYSFPSITTVLGSVPNEGLKKWRARVGETEANRVSRVATGTGTQLHKLCENYLKNDSITKTDNEVKTFLPQVVKRFREFQPLLDRIDNIYLQEKAMASPKLGVSGTPDCIAEFDGVLSVIDFKTSKKPKPKDWIKNYFIQETAYSIMAFETYGLKPFNIVTLISCEEGEDQVFIEKVQTHYYDLLQVIENYKNGR